MSQGIQLRKYGVEFTVDFELYEVDGVALRTDWTPAQADCEIQKDGGNYTMCDNTAVVEDGTYSIVITATEAEAARLVLKVVDAATKVFLDKIVIVETYGNASAQHAFDLDTAKVTLADGAQGGSSMVLTAKNVVVSGAATGISVSGTAAGVAIDGGTTGVGLTVDGGSSSGAGLTIGSTSGIGLAVTAASGVGAQIVSASGNGMLVSGVTVGANFTASAGDGVQMTSNGSDGDGLAVTGNGTGHGLLATGGATGNGIRGLGGATSGAGLYGGAQNNNDAGISAVANGTGDDLAADNLAQADKLLGYVQLLARGDEYVETDRSTELAEINADEGSGAGGYQSDANSLQAIRDHGDQTWVTGGGVGATASYTTEAWTRDADTDDDGGAGSDTLTVNGAYFASGETNAGTYLEVDATFTITDGEQGLSVDFWGFYQGGGAHSMQVQAYDTTGAVYEPIGTIAQGSAVEKFTFALSPSHTNTSTEEVKIKFLHQGGAGVVSHVFNVDKAQVNTAVPVSTTVTLADGAHGGSSAVLTLKNAVISGAAFGIDVTGTTAGIRSRGGTTGIGLQIAGGATSGIGLDVRSTSGDAMYLLSSGGDGWGINATGDGSGGGIAASSAGTGPGFLAQGYEMGNGDGMQLTGVGTGHGLLITGGATGNGARILGGATSGAGLYAAAQNNNDAGAQFVKNGTGNDITGDTASFITANNLDHLMKTAVANNADMTTEVPDGTVLSNMLSKTSDTSTYVVATDSLQGIADGVSGVADPWSTAVPGAYAAGTAGYILGTNLDAKISDIGGQSGSGSNTVTITINVAGSPKPGVSVWVSTDAAGNTVTQGTSVTDSSGEVEFFIDDGSFYVWKSLGGFNFTNPEALTVSGTTAQAYSGTAATGSNQIAWNVDDLKAHLVGEVNQEINADGDAPDRGARWCREAGVTVWNFTDWHFRKRSATLTTVADTATVDLPSDFGEIDQRMLKKYRGNHMRFTMDPAVFQDYKDAIANEADSTPGKGTPRLALIRQDTDESTFTYVVEIAPVPTAADTFTMWYVAADPWSDGTADDSTAPTWPQVFNDAWRRESLWRWEKALRADDRWVASQKDAVELLKHLERENDEPTTVQLDASEDVYGDEGVLGSDENYFGELP